MYKSNCLLPPKFLKNAVPSSLMMRIGKHMEDTEWPLLQPSNYFPSIAMKSASQNLLPYNAPTLAQSNPCSSLAPKHRVCICLN